MQLYAMVQYILRLLVEQGALLSKCITSSEVVAYDDLGTEAIRKLTVENFPVIVVIDKDGNNLYETAIKDYCRMEENA